jgi:hypothetical protein
LTSWSPAVAQQALVTTCVYEEQFYGFGGAHPKLLQTLQNQ